MLMNSTELPPPSPEALAHSQALYSVIASNIAEQGGIIDFARYMQHALYTPGLGYYTAGARKFGPAGDFVTAPEISPLFGGCLARQCSQVLRHISGAGILEVGAGSGKLARDILLGLKALDCLPSRYLILESSADLRQRQQHLLKESVPEFYDRIEWLQDLPQAGFCGVVIANELLDAFPAHRLIKTDNGFAELGVAVVDGKLAWQPMTERTQVVECLQTRLNGVKVELDNGYTTELCLAQDAWLASLAQRLDRALLLLIDYGYPRREFYHPQRMNGSLRCHYRHYAHDDPFIYPGLQDITVHVDFTALAEAAVANRLDVMGYTTQAYFLMSSGLTELVNMQDISDIERMEQAQQIKRLTMPGEMGESFKVAALGRKLDLDLLGFALRDQRHYLS